MNLTTPERKFKIRSFSTDEDSRPAKPFRLSPNREDIDDASFSSLPPRPNIHSIREKLQHRRQHSRDLSRGDTIPLSPLNPRSLEEESYRPIRRHQRRPSNHGQEGHLASIDSLRRFHFPIPPSNDNNADDPSKPPLYSEVEIHRRLKEVQDDVIRDFIDEAMVINTEAAHISTENNSIYSDYALCWKERENREVSHQNLVKELENLSQKCIDTKQQTAAKMDILSVELQGYIDKIKELEEFFMDLENKEKEIEEVETELKENASDKRMSDIKVIRQRIRCMKKTMIERIEFAQSIVDERRLELLKYDVETERLELENESYETSIDNKKKELVNKRNISILIEESNVKLLTEHDIKAMEYKILMQNFINFQREINDFQSSNADLKSYNERLTKTMEDQQKELAKLKLRANELTQKAEENKALEIKEKDLQNSNQKLKSKLYDFLTEERALHEALSMQSTSVKKTQYNSNANMQLLQKKSKDTSNKLKNIQIELQRKDKLAKQLMSVCDTLMDKMETDTV